ncbi:MAG: nucleotidyltransferase domain-containing protein [Candidatus Aenigmarchaeota archaeon]|nr:nucleotidyltransferase domain-containing protein [Candidatus Aenigmarchaeota archaeon]
MDLELRIVDLLARNPGRKFTINEIARELEEYYSFVHRTAGRLAKDDVIDKSRVGKSYICSLNMENEKTLALMVLGEIEKKDEFYGRNRELGLMLEDLVKSLSTQPGVDAIVLFGSYAKGAATKESDVDILVVAGRKAEIGRTAKEMYAKYGKEINPVIITSQEFRKQKEKAIIKEIISGHCVLYGAKNFVNLVFGK